MSEGDVLLVKLSSVSHITLWFAGAMRSSIDGSEWKMAMLDQLLRSLMATNFAKLAGPQSLTIEKVGQVKIWQDQ